MSLTIARLRYWCWKLAWKLARKMAMKPHPPAVSSVWVAAIAVVMVGQLLTVQQHHMIAHQVFTSMYWGLGLAFLFGLAIGHEQIEKYKEKAKLMEEMAAEYQKSAEAYYQQISKMQEWIIFPIDAAGNPLTPDNPPWAVDFVQEDDDGDQDTAG